jgi:hypothetical protein
LKKSAGHEKYADAVGRFFKDRYGGLENIKRTLARDPVGMLADLSTVMSLGGTAAARAPGLAGQVGQAVRAAGRVTDPINIAARAIGPAARAAAGPVGLMTGTGGEALRTAERAGEAGGARAQAFRESLAGDVPMEQVVTEARDAVANLRRERGQLYREGMRGVQQASQQPLPFDRIDQALRSITEVQTFHGVATDEATQAIRQRIGQEIARWRQLPAVPYHTAEGLDALKQRIGNLRDVQPGTPEARVVREAQAAIRGTIRAEVPEYAGVMRGYEEASNLINEIERTLSLNPNASIDTALRKLQSTLRDNVNTNFGQRRYLADVLVEHGAPHLMERLAGQSLRPGMPRGLSRLLAGEISAKVATLGGAAAGAGAAVGGSALAGGAAGAAAALPFMSPRVMGETFYGIGRARQLAEARHPTGLAFQAGRVARELDPRKIIQNEARAALREKKDSGLTQDQVTILRQASRAGASADLVMKARDILESAAAKRERTKPLQVTVRPQDAMQPQPFAPTPGLPQGPQTPSPGESSYQGPQ